MVSHSVVVALTVDCQAATAASESAGALFVTLSMTSCILHLFASSLAPDTVAKIPVLPPLVSRESFDLVRIAIEMQQ